MLKIYYGRENLDKEKFIFSNVSGKTFVMVPDQYTLEAERQAFRHLAIKSLMDVEIVSATSLGQNILSEQGGNKRQFIDKYGRHMLLYKASREQRENLQIFRGMETKDSFIESVNNFISEMKQYNCSAEDLRKMALSSGEDTYTCKKLLDMYTIFAQYEKLIEGKYTDSEDYIDLFLDRIKDSLQIKDSKVWVYGYDSFAPKTLELLGRLIESAEEVNIVLTWDDKGRDRELFQLTSMVINRLEAIAEVSGSEVIKKQIPDEFLLNSTREALRHVEKELYALPAQRCQEDDGITLIEAANIYNEAESAASYVLHLVRDKGLRYRDIRLVCNDMQQRRAAIERVFEEYGIEVFSDVKRDILSNPIIQFVTSLINVVVEKYSTEAVMSMLKSGFTDLTSDEIAQLENYAIQLKIKGTMWKKPFRRGQSIYGDALLEIEEQRKKAIHNAEKLEECFNSKTTGEFLKKFYKFLEDELRLGEKTLEFIAVQEGKGLYDLADETAQIWDSFMGILNQIYEIMGDEEFNREIFRDMLMVGLKQVQIGLLPPTEDGLILGNIQRSRSARVKAIVVIGANEGVFPQEKPSQGIFSAEERELFRENGKELCKVDSIRFMEEKMAVYRTLSLAEEYLWVGYSVSDGEGNQLKPSPVFIKLQELFPGKTVERDVLNREKSIELINGKTSGMRHLSSALLEVGEGNAMEDSWKEALAWFEQNEPDRIETIRKSFEFTGLQEDLGRKAAEALFKKDLDRAMALSPSRLERYSRCPFSHMVLYGLKPEERRVFEASPREIGDIYHQCLMKLTETLTKEDVGITEADSPWMKITKEECREIVDSELEKISGEYREGLFAYSKEDVYRASRVAEVCYNACWTVIEQVRAGRIVSIMPEVPFGRGKRLEPIEIDVKGEKVYIEGIIDRVDILNDNRVKIIDYKTGNEHFRIGEAMAGYRLQLMLYLKAACEKDRKPAGVFYFRIQEPMVDLSEKDVESETIEKEIRKSFKLDGILVDDPVVIGDIAGEFEGFSEIVPLRKTKNGINPSGDEGLLLEGKFIELQDAVMSKVKEACEDLLNGKVSAHPMKTKERSACTYCQYKGICRFDTIFENCRYNIIS